MDQKNTRPVQPRITEPIEIMTVLGQKDVPSGLVYDRPDSKRLRAILEELRARLGRPVRRAGGKPATASRPIRRA
jgi:hypothetical protein